MVFISGEPPLSTFLKVNINASLTDGSGGARFVIYGLYVSFVAVRGSHLIGTLDPGAKMRVA